MSKIIAIIAARGNSKRLPRKNIRELAGKPLIAYPIQAALETKIFDKVIVTTDNEEIAKISKKYGAEVPFMRPKELATDSTLVGPVLKHTLNWLKNNENYEPDAFVLLQAPCPFVKFEQIKKVVEKLLNSDAEAVYTVNKVEYSPYWMQTLIKTDEGNTPQLLIKDFDLRFKQLQDMPQVYRPNGAVYAVKLNSFLRWDERIPLNLPSKGFNTKVEIIDEISAFDIDTIMDFKIAEEILKGCLE